MSVAQPIVNQLHDTEARWFALRTRAKCEKQVAQLLGRKQIHAYLPLVKSVKRYVRKVKKVEKPLISGYVFVKIIKSEYVPALETENVVGFVRFSKDLPAIPESEIVTLRRIVLESDIELSASPGNFGVGDPVSITAGPLTGLSGSVISHEGKRRLQIELQHLGYSLLITVDAAFLEKNTLG